MFCKQKKEKKYKKYVYYPFEILSSASRKKILKFSKMLDF